ncbi:MAG TPA: hypothetical protein VN327_16785 [Pseudonocardiaceae bacterium]|jgi:hypothetical protein|nr:hypothetical protein [Pseudonocardiaceae bacterium]
MIVKIDMQTAQRLQVMLTSMGPAAQRCLTEVIRDTAPPSPVASRAPSRQVEAALSGSERTTAFGNLLVEAPAWSGQVTIDQTLGDEQLLRPMSKSCPRGQRAACSLTSRGPGT